MWLYSLKSRSLLATVVFTNFLDYLLLTAVGLVTDPIQEIQFCGKPYLGEIEGRVVILFTTELYILYWEDTKNIEAEAIQNLTTLMANITDLQYIFNMTTASNITTERPFIERVLHIPVRAINENSKVGWLLGSKALVQMVANPIVGYLSNRVSYKNLLLFGTSIFFVSSSLFAIAETFLPLLVARASQGIGSAATTIAGMSLIAESNPDDNERSRAMGIAMGGYALGILVGYPFGGLLYAVSGKTAPFVGIMIFCLINIGLQFLCLDDQAGINKVQMKSSSLHKLLLDPYILLCSGAIMITSMSLSVLESTVPIWVMDTMDAHQWQLGLIFIPDSVGYLVGTNTFPVVARKYGRWKFTVGSMFLIGIGMLVIPFCKSLGQLLVPHLSLGLGVGVTDAAIMPLLALLIDQRHVSTYGSVYAIVQLAVCLAYSLGPAIAGQIVKLVGFEWTMWGMTILNLLFLPLCVFLKSPPVEEDLQCILADINQDERTSIEKDRNNANYQSFYLE